MQHHYKLILPLTIAALASACGSGGDDGGDSSGGSSSKYVYMSTYSSEVGRFVDSAVGGVEYCQVLFNVRNLDDSIDAERIDQCGITDSDGSFSYTLSVQGTEDLINPVLDGDGLQGRQSAIIDSAIRFNVRGIQLPDVPVDQLITPLSFSADNSLDQTAINVARLLVSLDSNNNLEDGIYISGDDFSNNILDFGAESEVFATAAQVTLNEAELTLAAEDEVITHVNESLSNLTQLAGTWVFANNSQQSFVQVSLFSDGTYTHIEKGDEIDPSGMEWGSYTLSNGEITFKAYTDNNGAIGLIDSPLGSTLTTPTTLGYSLSEDTNTLTLVDGNESFDLVRAANITDSIVGTWKPKYKTRAYYISLSFFENGLYSHGELGDADEPDGIEIGQYDLNSSTGRLIPTLYVDTNGSTGLSDAVNEGEVLTVEVNGDELTFNGEMVFVRQ
ncbi:hypothetical protein QFX18_00250 [Saccharophagus degradans]|uniref:hypothetical protein n=1 Tax=Saccharophagus degradans TaxID=86304 RepID=UPI002477DADF|nr:hypothetical protein [Saccharophagus degradans]WGO98493.1 hypothetical protein QFX18_00250 [Saccharophagus degradans]